MIKLNGYEIKPTIFPDKTSQVWKVPEEYFDQNQTSVITWEFENEAELLHVAQLKELVYLKTEGRNPILELPYLPYARQDKPIANDQTFSLHSFAALLNAIGFTEVFVFDPHNVELTKNLITNVNIVMPDLLSLVVDLNAAPVFPDKGAAARYKASPFFIHGQKERDALTGTIKGIKLIGKIEPRTYLIVDDICDGGRTFIEVAKQLYAGGAVDVHLYVSHGIFSKGLEPLREAGIRRIFTRKGEIYEFL